MNTKLHSVVTKTVLGTTLSIATGFLALAGISSPSFAAAAKPAAKPVTHAVIKPKAVSTKPKAVATSKHVAKKHTTKHAAKHTAKHESAKHEIAEQAKAEHESIKRETAEHAVKHTTAKKSTKHSVKPMAKKSIHVTAKPKSTVSTTTAPKKK